jgi:hypothetical protein
MCTWSIDPSSFPPCCSGRFGPSWRGLVPPPFGAEMGRRIAGTDLLHDTQLSHGEGRSPADLQLNFAIFLLIRIPFPGCSVRHCTRSDKQLEKRLAAWYTGCVRELRKSGTARQKLGRSIFRGKRAALRLVFTFFKGRTPWATPHFRQESQYRGDQI